MDNGFAKGLWLTFLGWCSSLYAYFLPLYDWWLAVTILWVARDDKPEYYEEIEAKLETEK